ncbi:cysteine hydrolase family protein [Aestuariivirga sp. YIM B02566]|uniref:Cysteine hydrolase n=1 Tax=Taklimakanibacter albus TaxID=2800327 RepID=A0ACC5R4T6_9HYPH|nr:isochorismatase family cysteine hydrolase [Aestuariivirga sp. YIM B02566]MBK1867672.1 cysteine hydrolase [Aestuariivirga sp. YIM B02566]
MTLTRLNPIAPKSTALLVIDVQNGTYSDKERAKRPYFHERATNETIPNIVRLLTACRRAQADVIFTVIESLTLDGRDRSLDYKLSGFNFSKGSWEAQIPIDVAPLPNEIVLPKTSSSLFNSTVFDYVLRNIGIDTVLVTGFLTDQCVDHTIRDGADRGFYMTCIADACATESPERHEAALSAFKGYCRIRTTAEVVAELGKG